MEAVLACHSAAGLRPLFLAEPIPQSALVRTLPHGKFGSTHTLPARRDSVRWGIRFVSNCCVYSCPAWISLRLGVEANLLQLGVSPQRLFSYVKQFYEHHGTDNHTDPISTDAPCPTPSIDNKFLDRVWQWLVRSSDIRVGHQNEYKGWSLRDVEAQFPDSAIDLSKNDPIDRLGGLGESRTAPRLFASQNLVYHALVGHGPDRSRVFDMEYQLLCAIAATRYDGILQGELGRITGQDKRSVPKRNDLLQEKGYIVKRPAWMGGHKTSRLYLRRFAQHPAPAGEHSKVFSMKDLAMQVITTIQASACPITQDQLAMDMSMTDSARAKLLGLLVRALLRIGCIKRLRAAFGTAAKADDLKICLQVVRPLQASDCQHPDSGLNFDVSVESALAGTSVHLASDDPEATENIEDDDDDLHNAPTKTSTSQTRPQWNPDRLLTNQLFDRASQEGIHGMTNKGARQDITGPFVRRPVESLLVRLSHAALRSQPYGAERTAIVRTQENVGSSKIYIHRTFDFYHDNVNAGISDWSELPGGLEVSQRLKATHGQLAWNRDCFGLVDRGRPKLQAHNGQASLGDVIRSSRIQNCAIRNGELGIVRRNDGTFEISPIISTNDRGRSDSPEHSSSIKKSKSDGRLPKDVNTPVRGRPRKNATRDKRTKGLHPWAPRLEHYWRHMFLTAKIQEDPTYPANLDAPGLMAERPGLEMFNRRPDDFEALVLEALRQNLPVPSRVVDVTQGWVDKMKEVLHRQNPGLYIAPTGMLIASKSRFERVRRSCKIIFKSMRLHELDLREHRPISCVFNNISSISHSHRRPKPYFWYRGPTPTWLMLLEKPFETDPVSAARTVARAKQQAIKQGKEHDGSATDRSPPQSFLPTLSHEPFNPASIISVPLEVATAVPGDSQTSDYRNPQAKTVAPAVHDGLVSQSLLQNVDGTVTKPVEIESSSADLRSTDSLNKQTQLRRRSNIPQSPEVLLKNSLVSGIEENEALRFDADLQPTQTPSHEICKLNVDDHVGQSQKVFQSLEQDQAEMTSGDRAVPREMQGGTFIPDELLEAHDEPILDPALRSTGPGLETVVYGADMWKDTLAKPTGNDSPAFLRGRDATKEYKRYILELVTMVGGVMPHSPPTLKRAMKARCLERNVDPEPNIKLIKSQINLLCNAGKLKDVKIAFQDRSGRTHFKWIIALPDISITDPRFVDLQNKIVVTPPDEEYVQQEMEAEASRIPNPLVFRTPPCSDDEPPKKKSSVLRTSQTRAAKARDLEQGQSSAVLEQGSPVPLKPATANAGFLSLNVPNLGHLLATPSEGREYIFRDAPSPLTFHTNANAANSNTAYPTPTAMRKSGARLNSKSNVRWLPKKVPLPKTLRSIMIYGRALTEAEINAENDPDYFKFEHEILFVSAWEQQNFEHLEQRAKGQWCFINHFASHKVNATYAQPTDSQYFLVKFDASNEDGCDTAMPPAESWPAFVAVSSDRAKKRGNKPNKRRRASVDGEEFNSRDSDIDLGVNRPRRKKVKRSVKAVQKDRTAEKLVDEDEDDEEGTLRSGRGRTGLRLQREARGVGTRRVADAVILRIITAVTVVSVLSGGLDKYANWKYIARLITHEPEAVVRQRWKVIKANYTQEIDAITSNFQTRYLDALADGIVPTVKFDNLDETDWERIFEWAVDNIDHSKVENPVLDLPEEREELLQLNHVEVPEAKPMRELYTMGLHFSHPTREAAFCSVMHGITYKHGTGIGDEDFSAKFPLEEAERDEDLARARSWVLAAILTPSSGYNVQHTRRKLLRLGPTPQRCDELIEKVTRTLKSERLIVDKDSVEAAQLPNGQTLSGTHSYKLSTRFFEMFEHKRMITPTMLRGAVEFKRDELDTRFARGEEFVIHKEHENLANGDMVAIMNLLALDQIDIAPGPDVPARRYGIDSENQGYKTRSMDKNILAFTMKLQPTSTYQCGDITSQQRQTTPVPHGQITHDLDSTAPIPPWFDINLTFHPGLWEMYLAAIIGLISLRPGISSVEVMRVLASVLVLRDVEMVIAWLRDAGYVQHTRTGWETTEWWWCAIGAGAEGGVTWNI